MASRCKDANLLSFCSKVCAYFNRWYYSRDDYYIYDYYVKESLQYYLKEYQNEPEVKKALANSKHDFSYRINRMTYQQFFPLTQALNEARDRIYHDHLSKEGLDHLLWYSYHKFAQRN